MSNLVIFAPAGGALSDEESVSFSTSSSDSLSLSPKFKPKAWTQPRKVPNPAQLQSLRQRVGKCRQLISAETEKSAQLREECAKLSLKAQKLELAARELHPGTKTQKLLKEQIAVEKLVAVQLQEDIAGLESVLADRDELKSAIRKVEEDLSSLRGERLSRHSIPQLARLFAQQCSAIDKLNAAIRSKLLSLEDADLCIVCVASQRCAIFVPCGHLVVCWRCCCSVSTCPVCRAVIDDRFQTEARW